MYQRSCDMGLGVQHPFCSQIYVVLGDRFEEVVACT